MIYATIGRFRLASVTRLTKVDKLFTDKPNDAFTQESLIYGLSIEAECPKKFNGKTSYYVIAFLKPDTDDEPIYEMHTVGDRFFKAVTTQADLDIIQDLYRIANRLYAAEYKEND